MAYEDARWSSDIGVEDVVCNHCKHYLGFGKCKAFPKGIPGELMDLGHKVPYPGDQGYLFEPIEE